MSSTFKIIKICENCGEEFEARKTVTRFCSHACNSRYNKRKVREAKIEKSNLEVQLMKNPKLLKKPSLEESLKKEFLKPGDVAVILGTSIRTIYVMIKEGRLQAGNLGIRMTRIARSDLMDLLRNPEFAITPGTEKETSEDPLTIQNCYAVQDIIKMYGVTREAIYAKTRKFNIQRVYKGNDVYYSKREINKLYRHFKRIDK